MRSSTRSIGNSNGRTENLKLAMSYVLLLLTVIAGCTTTQSRFVVLGSPQSDRPENCEVQVFRNGTPQHQFARVARIDVHVERTFFMQPGFEDALPELRRQACLWVRTPSLTSKSGRALTWRTNVSCHRGRREVSTVTFARRLDLGSVVTRRPRPAGRTHVEPGCLRGWVIESGSGSGHAAVRDPSILPRRARPPSRGHHGRDAGYRCW